MGNRRPSGIFVKTPVMLQDTYSVDELAILFRVSRNKIYEMSRREEDPLPLRSMSPNKRGLFAYRDDVLEWGKRNAH